MQHWVGVQVRNAKYRLDSVATAGFRPVVPESGQFWSRGVEFPRQTAMVSSMRRSFRAYAIHFRLRAVRFARRRFGHRLLVVERLGGYYVELGANDGITASNTASLEFYNGWRGLLIEPVPAQFEKLVFNRSSRRNRFANVACVSFGFGKDSIQLAEANLMTIAIEGESDVADPVGHARLGRLIQPGYDRRPQPEIIEVPARTLTDVLYEAGAPTKIDFLCLDVEGAELEVLKGLRFDLFSFDWMMIECRSPERLIRFLAQEGYVVHSALGDGRDLMFVHAP